MKGPLLQLFSLPSFIATSALILFNCLSVFASAGEWCPKRGGKSPTAVVDLGVYKMYYFTDLPIDSKGVQKAEVELYKNQKLVHESIAHREVDTYPSTVFEGSRVGFSCDSVNLNFESAWFIDENGHEQSFNEGAIRAAGHDIRPLECRD